MISEELLIVHAITGHGINLSGTREKKAVWDTSLKVTYSFLDLASAPLMTLSQPSRDLWYSWYDHTCSSSEINLAKMPDPSNFKAWNSNRIELLTREYIVGDNVLLHTALFHHHVTGGVWRMMDNTS